MSIILNSVSYRYMADTPFAKTALDDINLEIAKGEFVGVIGHTGSGKSTLMQHLNGLLKPSDGQVMIEDVNIHDKSQQAKDMRRKVGMVFQYPEHQLFEETVFEDIAFGPRNMGIDEAEVEERVIWAMQFVGLDYEEYAKRSPFQLSGGQMRRVAIAGVIAMKPEYLILDEPSAGLDPRGRNEIFEQIAKLYQTTGITVVLVSHNMEEVARLVNRLIVMHSGNIILDGPPAQIFQFHQPELLSAGVDVPNVTALLALLKQQGLAVDQSILTHAEAADSIYQAIRRQQSC